MRKQFQPRTDANSVPGADTDSERSGKEKIYGKHSVRAALMMRPGDVLKLVLAGKPDYHQEAISLAQRHNIPVAFLSWPEFRRAGQLVGEDNHQGIFCFANPRIIGVERDLQDLVNAKSVLLLDQVSNPQNLATIIRSAAFFGFDAIIYMRHRAATPTAEVVRYAVGGAELIEFYCVANLVLAIETLRDIGYHVVGLDERGSRILPDLVSHEKLAFVIGAEGEGLRQRTRKHCSELVSIPGGHLGLESLNAGVAATVAMYEAKRLTLVSCSIAGVGGNLLRNAEGEWD